MPSVVDKEFEEKIVHIRRVAKVTKGGKNFHFTALVVVGNTKGKVGVALGKSNEVPDAIRKAVEKAKKNLITVYRNGTTINHEAYATYLSSRVMIRPASSGTGVIAGAAVRSVLELAGIKDVLTKSLGSRNPINVVTATIKCLEQLTDPEDKAGQLGKTASDLDLPKQFYKNKSEGEVSA
jgi:small subunit ribosomal protein S5